jgi:hypothetical protein
MKKQSSWMNGNSLGRAVDRWHSRASQARRLSRSSHTLSWTRPSSLCFARVGSFHLLAASISLNLFSISFSTEPMYVSSSSALHIPPPRLVVHFREKFSALAAQEERVQGNIAVVGINRRFLLRSTVGSCWDRPSAFVGIDRKLQGELC